MAPESLSRPLADLSGQAALVTGAGAGVGRAAALALASAGAAVFAADLNPDRADTVADEIVGAGGQAAAWQADVANRFQVGSMIEAARDRFTTLHILVNAAGVYKTGTFAKLDEWDWRRLVDVNLTGAFFCTQMLTRVWMDEQTEGAVVNIGSTAAQGAVLAEGVGYAASKAGLLGLTRQSARELAPYNIRVNAVCPGNLSGGESAGTGARLARTGTDADAAAAIVFFCTPAARFITGQTLSVDGGEALA